MQWHSGAVSAQVEAFLSGLIGKAIIVHTLAVRAGASQGVTLSGRLESNYSDALVLEKLAHEKPTGQRILVYKWAIVAIET